MEPSLISISGQEEGSPIDSSISISGREVGQIDTTGFTERVPVLKKIEPNIDIRPTEARTIAQIPIRRGKLEALALRARAIIGDLTVADYTGPIRITATPFQRLTFDDGSAEKVLVLNDLPTEDLATGRDRFFICNFSDRMPNNVEPEASHFQLYARLDSGGRVGTLTAPTNAQIDALGAPPLISTHPFGRHLINDFGTVGGSQCTVTGCC